MLKTLVIVFSLFFIVSAKTETMKPSIVVHLLDYLANDYAGAVKNGKVINESEYAEQKEFAEIVQKSVQAIEVFKNDKAFAKGINELVLEISTKVSAERVSREARELQSEAINLAEIEVAPAEWPKLVEGKALFQKKCASCHGKEGKGDGPAATNLNPKPANFWEASRQKDSSPFQYYNTIRLGVPGTAMAAWPNISDKEVWAIAFYLKSIGRDQSTIKQSSVSLKEAASMKDSELLKIIPGTRNKKDEELNRIRTYQEKEKPSVHFLAIARNHLDQSMTYYFKNSYEKAASHALKSYLEGIEPLEAKIRANDAGLATEIETQMASFRNSLNARSKKDNTKIKYENILITFDKISSVITDQKMSASLAFSAAFAIFLREGFEAVLLIITLLSVIRSFKARKAAHWVHAGWGTALLLGLVTWFGSGYVISMSGVSRELTEGWVSLLAVIVLLYVGFWLHRQTEVGRWTKFVKKTIHDALESKNLIVLAGIAFISVFREAFEVVLFLRAIWNDVDLTGQKAMVAGILLAFILIFAFSYLALKYSQKIPVRKLFVISSLVMAVLSIVLVGKGIHSFQEAGFIPASDLPVNLRIDLLGVFPTFQTSLAQLVILIFLYLLWHFGSRADKKLV